MEGQDSKGTLWLILLSFIFITFGGELRVCKGCKFNSIKEAVKHASPGDTVIVEKGIYREGTILINKPLRLIGEGYPTLDGEGKHEVVRITASNVTFEGFRVINSGVSELEDIAGIKVINARRCVIRNNILENNFWGIYLAKVKDCIVEGNRIKGSGRVSEVYTGNGIHLWHCRRVIVRNNRIEKHRDGIYFEFVRDSLIANNLSRDNWRYGLHFMFSHDDTYVNNTFVNNGAGVAVMYSKRVVMVHNTFLRNWGDSSYGLLLKAIDDSLIMNNRFIKNSVGITMDECQRSKIVYNDFVENGWALRIWANSTENLLSKNNFIANTFEVSTNSTKNFNRIELNYWSSYRGFDLNRDGVGDIPHKPVKLFSYIVSNNPAAIILLKSFFVEILNYMEEAIPAVVSIEVQDPKPLMRRVEWRY